MPIGGLDLGRIAHQRPHYCPTSTDREIRYSSARPTISSMPSMLIIMDQCCGNMRQATAFGDSQTMKMEFSTRARSTSRPTRWTRIAAIYFGRAQPGGSISDQAKLDTDLVYVSSFDAMIHAVEKSTGDVRWTADAESGVWGAPAFADGRVFLCGPRWQCVRR